MDLQSLLDHTTQRILTNIDLGEIEENSKLTFVHKIGFDGCTGQFVYKQTTSDDARDLKIEESLFLTCTVPLEISYGSPKKVLWINTKPSSTSLCRPVRFQFKKETPDVLKKELEFIKQTDLRPTLGNSLAVEHILEVTMNDGKVHTALSDQTNSSQASAV